MSDTGKKFLFINRKPPYGTAYAKEALDAVLMGSAFGQQMAVVFTDDGVFQLVQKQSPEAIGIKGPAATLPVLPMYDVHDIYVEAEALQSRGLSPDDLLMDVKLIDTAQLADLMDAHDIILSF